MYYCLHCLSMCCLKMSPKSFLNCEPVHHLCPVSPSPSATNQNAFQQGPPVLSLTNVNKNVSRQPECCSIRPSVHHPRGATKMVFSKIHQFVILKGQPECCSIKHQSICQNGNKAVVPVYHSKMAARMSQKRAIRMLLNKADQSITQKGQPENDAQQVKQEAKYITVYFSLSCTGVAVLWVLQD